LDLLLDGDESQHTVVSQGDMCVRNWNQLYELVKGGKSIALATIQDVNL